MFEEVPPEWLSKVYVSERFLEEPEAEQLLAGKTYEVVADAVFKSISDTQTPQGILCLGAYAAYPAFRSAARGQDTSAVVESSRIRGIWEPCCGPARVRELPASL